MKTKIALTLAVLFSSTVMASSQHSVDSNMPFEHEKKIYKNKIMEKLSNKRPYIDQEETSESFISRIDPRLEREFLKLSPNKATTLLNKENISNEDILLSGLFFYQDGKYQSMPLAIQQFYKGYLNKDAGSTYFFGLMTIKGQGIHQNRFKGLEILKKVSGDDRYESLASMKLAEYLVELDQGSASLDAYDSLKTRDKDYLIGNIHYSRGDVPKALEHYQKAVDSGFREANYPIAKEMLKSNEFDINKVVYLLEEVIDYGSDRSIIADAQMLLGDIYFLGTGYNYADHGRGVEYYKDAADLGHYAALLKLNSVYLENEEDNKYRLGKNKNYIHKLNVRIKEYTPSKF